MVRSLLELVLYAVRQLPAEYKVEVDSQKLLDSVTIEVDGVRQTTGDWDLAPGWLPDKHSSPAPGNLPILVPQDALRASHVTEWAAFHEKIAGTVPRAVAKGLTRPWVFNMDSALAPDYDSSKEAFGRDFEDAGYLTDDSQRYEKTKRRTDADVDLFKGERPIRMPSTYSNSFVAWFDFN